MGTFLFFMKNRNVPIFLMILVFGGRRIP